jgi:hypothetical protein
LPNETNEQELGLLMAGITEMPDKPIADAVAENLAHAGTGKELH